MDNRIVSYLKDRLEIMSLEDLFEYFGLDPLETIYEMHLQGYLDLEDFVEDEVFEMDLDSDEDPTV